MRVSNQMMVGRVLYNTQRALSDFLKIQTGMSSGRRINKASDDPLGTQQDLAYRNELSRIDQFGKSIGQARNWMQTYDSVLGDLKNLMTTAKEVAIAMANGTFDNIAREGSANEIESIFDQFLQLSESQIGGRYMLSGYKTDTKPLTASKVGVSYNGDLGQIDYRIESSARMTINVTGNELFLKPLANLGENADLNLAVNNLTNLADLHNGAGIDLAAGQFSITDRNLGITSTTDISGATTIMDALALINAQLAVDGITNLTAELGPERNNIKLNIDEASPKIMSATTRLSQINAGSGLDLSPGRIVLTDGATNWNIDLSGATTIGDIITSFNAQAPAGVTLQIAGGGATGLGLEIVDTNPLGLTVQDTSVDETTAKDLGLLGSVGALLTGTALNPNFDFSVAEVGGTTAADLGILTDFSVDQPGSDLDPLLLATDNVIDLDAGFGLPSGSLIISQGQNQATLDLSNSSIVTVQDLMDAFANTGLNISAQINADGRGIEIINNDPNQSLTIIDETDRTAAKDLGIYGSGDMMGSLLVLVHALRTNDQDGTARLLENVDLSIQHLLSSRASVGAKAMRLETTAARLISLQFTYESLLSEVEDADITLLVTQLATQEAAYRASMMATAKIIQPTLMDFLR